MWHASVPGAELESAHQNYLIPQKGGGGLSAVWQKQQIQK